MIPSLRTTDCTKILEARGGIEPPIRVLQTLALPLGDRATDAIGEPFDLREGLALKTQNPPASALAAGACTEAEQTTMRSAYLRQKRHEVARTTILGLGDGLAHKNHDHTLPQTIGRGKIKKV
jgi:hypothetical protein